MEFETQKEILEMREEIELELIKLLEEIESDLTLEDIKEMIYEEEEQEDFQDLIAVFDVGQDVAELNNALELISDAWNYFPHRVLGGLSPKEILLQAKNSNK